MFYLQHEAIRGRDASAQRMFAGKQWQRRALNGLKIADARRKTIPEYLQAWGPGVHGMTQAVAVGKANVLRLGFMAPRTSMGNFLSLPPLLGPMSASPVARVNLAGNTLCGKSKMYERLAPLTRWHQGAPPANTEHRPQKWGLSVDVLKGNQHDIVSVLPHEVAELVDEIVAVTGATSELVLAMVLGTSAIGVQCVYDILPPDLNMKAIPASLFVLAIAASTQRKSAVIDILTEELVEYQQSEVGNVVQDAVQNARLRGWKSAQQRFLAEIEAHYDDDQKVAELTEKLRALEASRPGCRQKGANILNRDTSWSALVGGVGAQSPSTSIVTAEARSMLPNLRRWMPLINEMYDGAPIKRDRTTSESVMQPAPRLSLALSLQPKKWNEYVEDNGEDFLESGTGGRALLVNCPSRTHSGEIRRHAIATRARDRHNDLLKRLLSIFDKNLKRGAANERNNLRCSRDAGEQWLTTRSWIELNLNQGGSFSRTPEFGGRCAENILRVAAVLHVIAGCKGTEVSLEIMKSAILVMRFFAEQHVKMFGDLRTPAPERHAVHVEEYLARYFAQGNYHMIPIRRIQNATLGGRELRAKKANVLAALEVLERKGVIRIHNGVNGPAAVSLNYEYFRLRSQQCTGLFSH